MCQGHEMEKLSTLLSTDMEPGFSGPRGGFHVTWWEVLAEAKTSWSGSS